MIQGTKTVYVFYGELLSLLRELRNYRPQPKCVCAKCDCGWEKAHAQQDQKDVVFKFLSGLNKEFSGVRTQIRMRKPFPTLGEAFNIVQREELQKVMGMPLESPTLMAASAQLDLGQPDKEQSAKQVAFAERSKFQEELHCDNCKKRGHTRDR